MTKSLWFTLLLLIMSITPSLSTAVISLRAREHCRREVKIVNATFTIQKEQVSAHDWQWLCSILRSFDTPTLLNTTNTYVLDTLYRVLDRVQPATQGQLCLLRQAHPYTPSNGTQAEDIDCIVIAFDALRTKKSAWACLIDEVLPTVPMLGELACATHQSLKRTQQLMRRAIDHNARVYATILLLDTSRLQEQIL